jgi:hypothetical protein
MDAQGTGSEVARLREQLRLEYEAAQLGLSGLAQGTAQHAFITRKLENMMACHATLLSLVGEQEANQILKETIE